MSDAPTLILPARAKLNLVLRIVGRRADGYHLLDTLFHTLQLHDDVLVARGGQGVAITVSADDPRLAVAADERNLAARALTLLQEAVGASGGFRVHVHKRIPHGAGLGGGSSDAAAALRLGNELLGQPLDEPALCRLAVGLGADVPFFLRGGSQWGRGIGDELSPAPHTSRHFVLVVPPFGCDTASVYKIHAARWTASSGAANVAPITVPENRDAAVGIGYCNDLEWAAEQLRPELGLMRRTVVDAGYAQVRMTGSGSTLFVACDDEREAERCGATLTAAFAAAGHQDVVVRLTCSGPPDRDRPERAPHARTPHRRE